MRPFKFFDWPRKLQATPGGGGNIVQSAIVDLNTSTINNYVPIPGFTVAIRTSGRPVRLNFVSTLLDPNAGVQEGFIRVVANSNTYAAFNAVIYRNGDVANIKKFYVNGSNSENRTITVPPETLNFYDTSAPAGLNTYTVEIIALAATTGALLVSKCKLQVIEE